MYKRQDAGTPGISDPGEELVRFCYEAGIEVTSLPGPAACITALTLSGLSTRRFCFEGFLPTDKKERQVCLLYTSSIDGRISVVRMVFWKLDLRGDYSIIGMIKQSLKPRMLKDVYKRQLLLFFLRHLFGLRQQ